MPAVPSDFPRTAGGVVSGSRLKLCLIRCSDGLYRESSSDEICEERHEFCEDLAQQLCDVALKDAAHHSHEEVLERVRVAVQEKAWTIPSETAWLIRRLQTLLGW